MSRSGVPRRRRDAYRHGLSALTTKVFGTIPVSPDGAFVRRETTVGGRQLTRSIFVSDQLAARLELLARAASLLDDLDDLDVKARAAIRSALDGPDDTVRAYIEFHLEELTAEELESLFGVPKATILPTTFVAKLELVGVAIHPAPGAFKIVLDYSLGREVSDQLLAMTFDPNGRVIQLSHES